MPDLRANFPMARDVNSGFLAVVFRNPARLVLLDAASGAVKASIKTCADADDVFFDAKRRRLYVSCGRGQCRCATAGRFHVSALDLLKTASGARTSLFVPNLDRLFVAARAGFFG